MKRIFIALKISDELKNEATKWRQKHGNISARWIKPENLHLTVIPPWHTHDIADVLNALKKTEDSISPFDIEFSRVTYGPNAKSPRLIWAEGKTPAKLNMLVDAIYNALKQKPGDRRYKLHLTLARFKLQDFYSFGVKRIEEKINWRQKAEELLLMQSFLETGGARYEILGKIRI